MNKREKQTTGLKKCMFMTVLVAFLLIPYLLCGVLLTYLARASEANESIEATMTTEAYTNDLSDIGTSRNDKEKIPEQQASSQESESLEETFAPEAEAEKLPAEETPPEEKLPEEEMQEEQSSQEELVEEQILHKVYLTFDDGPSESTPQILDILKEYQVKATFFVVGKEAEKYPEIVERIVQEGHTLAMHSYDHRYEELYSSREGFRQDVQRQRQYMLETFGVDCSIYRFPGGSSNTISKKKVTEFINVLQEEGLTYFDWNVDSGDGASKLRSAATIARNVIEPIEKLETAVVLLHDTKTKTTTIEALPTIIEQLLELEHTAFYPIGEDTELVQHITQK